MEPSAVAACSTKMQTRLGRVVYCTSCYPALHPVSPCLCCVESCVINTVWRETPVRMPWQLGAVQDVSTARLPMNWINEMHKMRDCQMTQCFKITHFLFHPCDSNFANKVQGVQSIGKVRYWLVLVCLTEIRLFCAISLLLSILWISKQYFLWHFNMYDFVRTHWFYPVSGE